VRAMRDLGSFEEDSKPRAYELPWTREMARQLQQAEREAEANGTGVLMTLPFEGTEDDLEQRFYPAPQEALPPKQAARESAFVLQQSSPSPPRDRSR